MIHRHVVGVHDPADVIRVGLVIAGELGRNLQNRSGEHFGEFLLYPTGNGNAEILLSRDDRGKDQYHRHRVTMIESIDENIVVLARMMFASA